MAILETSLDYFGHYGNNIYIALTKTLISWVITGVDLMFCRHAAITAKCALSLISLHRATVAAYAAASDDYRHGGVSADAGGARRFIIELTRIRTAL